MNIFLRKLIALGCIVAFFGCILCYIVYSHKYRIIDYKIPVSKNIIVLGNSMPEMSIDDSLLPKVCNLSCSGKGYLFCWLDVQQLLKLNPQVDSVILAISPIHIMEDPDGAYYDKVSLNSFKYYAPFFPFDDLLKLPEKSFFVETLIGGGIIYMFNPVKPGSYKRNERNKLQRDLFLRTEGERVVNVHKKRGESKNEITLYAIEQIKRVCQESNVKLIFLSTPIYQAVKWYNLSAYRSLVAEKLTSVPNEFWDYTDLSLPDSCYADVIHLNYKGAGVFTKILKQYLE